ncbi:MAG TPA: hypothetical protein PKA17_05415, partial [Phenylobacterium sp.]|nr:hypothetical protein [Phenylobacterium sp.]
LIALAAGAVLTAGLATAAAAAPGYGPPHGPPAYGAPRAPAWSPVAQRSAELERRIEMGQRFGTLSRSEAARLHAELRQIQNLERQYMRGGLTRWEMSDLNQRLDRLALRLRDDRRGPDPRYGYGYGPGRW